MHDEALNYVRYLPRRAENGAEIENFISGKLNGDEWDLN